MWYYKSSFPLLAATSPGLLNTAGQQTLTSGYSCIPLVVPNPGSGCQIVAASCMVYVVTVAKRSDFHMLAHMPLLMYCNKYYRKRR
jgi:hypothetical protein